MTMNTAHQAVLLLSVFFFFYNTLSPLQWTHVSDRNISYDIATHLLITRLISVSVLSDHCRKYRQIRGWLICRYTQLASRAQLRDYSCNMGFSRL